jgi:hypothetical protein
MTDQEMYSKIQFLANDDETLGCYIKGHYDDTQFQRVSLEFVSKELKWGKEEPYHYRKGYFKEVPVRDSGGCMLHFSETKLRGAYPIMEMFYQ